MWSVDRKTTPVGKREIFTPAGFYVPPPYRWHSAHQQEMKYGYARCSTNEDKQDIQRQIRELKASGAEEIVFEYPTYASGKMNVSELARVCVLSRPTVYKYLTLLK